MGDCREGWFSVTCWCDSGCPGRNILPADQDCWQDWKLLDLMREAAIVCTRCGQPATYVTVSSPERSGTILRWRIGDDAFPAGVVAREDP